MASGCGLPHTYICRMHHSGSQGRGQGSWHMLSGVSVHSSSSPPSLVTSNQQKLVNKSSVWQRCRHKRMVNVQLALYLCTVKSRDVRFQSQRSYASLELLAVPFARSSTRRNRWSWHNYQEFCCLRSPVRQGAFTHRSAAARSCQHTTGSLPRISLRGAGFDRSPSSAALQGLCTLCHAWV